MITPDIFTLQSISVTEACVRVGLSVLFAFLLGLERYSKDKPIGFRAYMIVALTSCIIVMMGLEVTHLNSTNDSLLTLDLGKIIAGVMTGVGFLGAGAIIHKGDNNVVGSSTGAGIWASAGVGLCLGFGIYFLALLAFITVISILFIGGLAMRFHKE